MLLKDKVVLVTGASAGIGRAVAVEAARQGADVAINYFDSSDMNADDTLAAIRATGRKGIAVKGDVALAGSAAAFVSAAVKELGRVDVFVSNAGICPFHSFLDMPHETFERTMRGQSARRLLHAAGRRQPDDPPGQWRRHCRRLVHLRLCWRRIPDPLHAHQGGACCP